MFTPYLTYSFSETVFICAACMVIRFLELAYVIVWLAVVFGINSTSNAGKKIVIVLGYASHYYNFHNCIVSTINS